MFRLLYRVLVLALLLPLASQVFAQQNDKQMFADGMTSLSSFLLQSAELATSRGREESVTSFAETITSMHQNFGADLLKAVEEEGLTSSRDMSQEYQEKLQALQTAQEDQFANAYFSAQVVALESMIRLMEGYGQDGPAGALKTFATNQIGGLRTLYIRAQQFSVP